MTLLGILGMILTNFGDSMEFLSLKDRFVAANRRVELNQALADLNFSKNSGRSVLSFDPISPISGPRFERRRMSL